MLSLSDQAQLEQWESAHGTPQQVALRCRIVLSAFAGQQNKATAARLQVSRPTVNLWRKRVGELGIAQVWEIAAGRGRKPHYDQAARDTIIKATLQTKPKGMTHWSCRIMAEEQKVSKDTVNRLWRMHNIKPHLSRTFKLSRDAKFLEKLTDVVGLYLNPPHQAVVLCLDEKSQIQALDRTQAGRPRYPVRVGDGDGFEIVDILEVRVHALVPIELVHDEVEVVVLALGQVFHEQRARHDTAFDEVFDTCRRRRCPIAARRRKGCRARGGCMDRSASRIFSFNQAAVV